MATNGERRAQEVEKQKENYEALISRGWTEEEAKDAIVATLYMQEFRLHNTMLELETLLGLDFSASRIPEVEREIHQARKKAGLKYPNPEIVKI